VQGSGLARKKTLLLGATSIVGYAIACAFDGQVLACRPARSRLRHRKDFTAVDLDDADAVGELLEQHQPTRVVYCHAVCDVSKCEEKPKWAAQVNVDNLARVLDQLPQQTHLTYVSSDHVFGHDGCYAETDTPCPISVYGQTRVAAEQLVAQRDHSAVARVGLAIGPSADGRAGHRDWLVHRHNQSLPITVIRDEARSAVWAADAAERVMTISQSGLVGLRHVVGSRLLDRPELATHLCKLLDIDPPLKISTRAEQSSPHLGRIELSTVYNDQFAVALPSPIESNVLKETTYVG